MKSCVVKGIGDRSGQSSSLANGNTASLYTSSFPCTELSVDDRFLQLLLPSDSQPRDSSHNSLHNCSPHLNSALASPFHYLL